MGERLIVIFFIAILTSRGIMYLEWLDGYDLCCVRIIVRNYK